MGSNQIVVSTHIDLLLQAGFLMPVNAINKAFFIRKGY